MSAHEGEADIRAAAAYSRFPPNEELASRTSAGRGGIGVSPGLME
jgi:hypothetical protein